jgi:hypothetical protein
MLMGGSSISTYAGRGTLKPGSISSEHSIAFLEGTKPVPLNGEYLDKSPIAIRPAGPDVIMLSTSRIRFGKTFTIDQTVKAKDIGMVIPEQLLELVQYWRDESDMYPSPTVQSN